MITWNVRPCCLLQCNLNWVKGISFLSSLRLPWAQLCHCWCDWFLGVIPQLRGVEGMIYCKSQCWRPEPSPLNWWSSAVTTQVDSEDNIVHDAGRLYLSTWWHMHVFRNERNDHPPSSPSIYYFNEPLIYKSAKYPVRKVRRRVKTWDLHWRTRTRGLHIRSRLHERGSFPGSHSNVITKLNVSSKQWSDEKCDMPTTSERVVLRRKYRTGVSCN